MRHAVHSKKAWNAGRKATPLTRYITCCAGGCDGVEGVTCRAGARAVNVGMPLCWPMEAFLARIARHRPSWLRQHGPSEILLQQPRFYQPNTTSLGQVSFFGSHHGPHATLCRHHRLERS